MFKTKPEELILSKLYDQDDFYSAFMDDLKHAKHQVIIESPFVTDRRMNNLLPIFTQLRKRGVQIIINTKPIDEHELSYSLQAENAIANLQALGVLVLLTSGHHRKISIIDKCITWEGSLNILSQNDSCEFMRRIFSEQLAEQMLAFLRLEKFIG
jgi:hypothetical protein